MKKFEIKVTYRVGYSIEEVEAKSFAAACLQVENVWEAAGQHIVNPITGFEIVDHSAMKISFPPVSQHSLKFCLDEDY